LIAIQIAKHLGAHVAATATGQGVQAVTDAGADEVIDYKTQDFKELLSDYDAVFDLVGGETFDTSLHVLKRGGKALSMAAVSPTSALEAELGVTVMSQMTRVTTEWLDELTKLVEAGVVTPHIDQVFTLDDIVEAFQAKEDESVIGKIVVDIHQ
jgi:NADPH:quinone reductase-like Zn-dependent oxidoreductase